VKILTIVEKKFETFMCKFKQSKRTTN